MFVDFSQEKLDLFCLKTQECSEKFSVFFRLSKSKCLRCIIDDLNQMKYRCSTDPYSLVCRSTSLFFWMGGKTLLYKPSSLQTSLTSSSNEYLIRLPSLTYSLVHNALLTPKKRKGSLLNYYQCFQHAFAKFDLWQAHC